MKVYIASDHGGFDLKSKILKNEELKITNYEFVDLGPNQLNPDDDYPDYALKVAEAVVDENEIDATNDKGFRPLAPYKALGILICRSGNGMVIAANKVNGAYAALAFSKKHAEKARQDDNANILCLDADYEGEDPVEIIKSFLEAEFAGMDSRHGRRFEKVRKIEKKY